LIIYCVKEKTDVPFNHTAGYGAFLNVLISIIIHTYLPTEKRGRFDPKRPISTIEDYTVITGWGDRDRSVLAGERSFLYLAGVIIHTIYYDDYDIVADSSSR
jgi:hypothetical protein